LIFLAGGLLNFVDSRVDERLETLDKFAPGLAAMLAEAFRQQASSALPVSSSARR
jgi:hypothetical protein